MSQLNFFRVGKQLPDDYSAGREKSGCDYAVLKDSRSKRGVKSHTVLDTQRVGGCKISVRGYYCGAVGLLQRALWF